MRQRNLFNLFFFFVKNQRRNSLSNDRSLDLNYLNELPSKFWSVLAAEILKNSIEPRTIDSDSGNYMNAEEMMPLIKNRQRNTLKET